MINMTEENNLSSVFEGLFETPEVANRMAKQLASQKSLVENNESARKVRDLFVSKGYCMECGCKPCKC